MINLIASLILIFIVATNIFLYKTTNSKMEKYNQFPPFILLDHTHSNRINPNSKINHLLDTKKETVWKKESPRLEVGWKFDIDLELKLTHTFDGEKFTERKFKKLDILPCNEKPIEWEVEIYLREAINVDKEMRWPDDYVIFQKKIIFSNKKFTISIPEYNLGDETIFPSEKIRILGFRARSEETLGCFQEIILE